MRRAALALVAVAALALPLAGSSATPITVYAAASLTQVFPRIDGSPRYSFAGSDQLAAQIENGAPADVFASASPKQAELLHHDGLLRRPVVFNCWSNPWVIHARSRRNLYEPCAHGGRTDQPR